MDSRLEDRLKKWHSQIERLKEIELICFGLEASEKSFHAELFLKASGSIAEREAQAYANQDWIEFKKGLAEAKSNLNHERRLLELKQKAYEASYLTFKIDSEAIKKHTQ